MFTLSDTVLGKKLIAKWSLYSINECTHKKNLQMYLKIYNFFSSCRYFKMIV